MSGQGDFERRIGRRGFIFNAAAGAVAISGLAAPATHATGRHGGRSQLTSGVQSGDVTSRGAVVWGRADRRAEMYVEVSPTESFRRSRLVRGPLATEATDFTAQVELDFLPPADEFHYRVAWAEPGRPRMLGEAEVGRSTPRRRGARSATCASCGEGTPPDRAGGSTPTSAGCPCTRRCAGASQTSSCTRAT